MHGLQPTECNVGINKIIAEKVNIAMIMVLSRKDNDLHLPHIICSYPLEHILCFFFSGIMDVLHIPDSKTMYKY